MPRWRGWIGASQDVWIPWGAVPEPRLARVVVTSTVRLPHTFSYPRVFDEAVDQLEASTDEAWQLPTLLRGQLQLVLDEDLRAEVAECRLRYDHDLGLLEEGGNSPWDGSAATEVMDITVCALSQPITG